MTVKELIEELQKMPQDEKVFACREIDCIFKVVNAAEVRVDDFPENTLVMVQLK